MKYTDYFTRLDECPKANEIIAFVKGFLFGNPDGLVFLYEVPHWECYPRWPSWQERLLYKEFLRQFPDKSYICEIPDEKAYICTLAIRNENSSWEREKGEKRFRVIGENKGEERETYKNRFVELIYKTDADVKLQVLGIHAPYRGPEFFKALKEYALNKREDEKFIIVGDLNADTVEGSTHGEILNEIKQCGYHLAVEALGKNVVTYFTKGTRIDHIMASPALNSKDGKDSKVTAYVIPQTILELSDHAAIIVDVQI